MNNMDQNIIEQIKLLIENRLSDKDKATLIKTIKKDKSLKREYLLQKELYKASFINRIRSKVGNKTKTNVPVNNPTPIYYIKTAAFADDEKFTHRGLPITDETINDFLNEDD